MRVLIRRLENRKGTTVFVDREMDVQVLRVGRGTDQDLELSDLRVSLAHAEIDLMPGGPYKVDAMTSNGVWVNGGPSPGARLNFDDVIDIGHFRLTVLKPDLGTDLAILVEEREVGTARDDESRPAYVTELSQTRLSRRGFAWLGFLVVVVTMLALPLFLRYGTGSAKAETRSALPSDHAWLSGPVASTHAFFETDCKTCHVKPFEAVTNNACLGCHDTVHHHVVNTKLAALTDFARASCTDCHREHNGPTGLIVKIAAQCTICHADPAGRFPGTSLQKVTSFATQHPDFAPIIPRYDAVKRGFTWTRTRLTLSTPLKEQTNLVFPHDTHLNPHGIDAPEGKRTLTCRDCHVLDTGEISFLPVTMEKNCADCHRLQFDPANPRREVPHGKPREVAGVIRDYFASKALTGQVKQLGTLPPAPERRRPGPQITGRGAFTLETAATWSETEGNRAVEEVFARRTCRYCHIVEETDDPEMPWTIAPVALAEHTITEARFNHRPHLVQECTSCHAAGRSHESSDVLLPGIDTCRQCHGDLGSPSQVASACVDCHPYHVESAPLWDAGATRRKQEMTKAHLAPMPVLPSMQPGSGK